MDRSWVVRCLVALVAITGQGIALQAQEAIPPLASIAPPATLAPESLAAVLADPAQDADVVAVGSTLHGYRVVLEGPLQRIQREALKAKKKHEPFTEAQITDDMRADVLFVIAWPAAPKRYAHGAITPAPLTILLRAKGSQDVLRPLRSAMFPEVWGNALGARLRGTGIEAAFRFSEIPSGDFEILIPTDKREYAYDVGRKARQRVR